MNKKFESVTSQICNTKLQKKEDTKSMVNVLTTITKNEEEGHQIERIQKKLWFEIHSHSKNIYQCTPVEVI